MSDLIVENQIGIDEPKTEFDIHDLEQTEGFAKLSPKQQQLIRVSLLINERSQRNINKRSTEHISEHNCHGSIAGLEREHFFHGRNEQLPKGFFVADYTKIDSPDGGEIEKILLDKIRTLGFPCVVHISDNPKTLIPGFDPQINEFIRPAHTFLVMGADKNGKTLVWDKEGYGAKYRAITLAEECQANDDYIYWGVRKLREER